MTHMVCADDLGHPVKKIKVNYYESNLAGFL